MKSITFFQYFSKATAQGCFSSILFVLRILLGLQFLLAGFAKLGDWSSAGYLEGATGPLATWFQSMAGNPLVDQLNIWGLILIGLALILGFLVRPASFFGAILMLLYYFAHFEQNTAHGLIDDHIIYIVIFVLFMSGGIGHIFGLDGLVSRNMRKKKRLLVFLFG
jgi:thiosulfate dehydrogenase (quinone) large subunit